MKKGGHLPFQSLAAALTEPSSYGAASAGAAGFCVPRAEAVGAASQTQSPQGDDVEPCLCPRCDLPVTPRVTAIVTRVARAMLSARTFGVGRWVGAVTPWRVSLSGSLWDV